MSAQLQNCETLPAGRPTRLFLRQVLNAAAIMASFLLVNLAALATPLDDYVAAPDPAFKYDKVNSEEKSDCTTTVYHLVSQTWLDETKVDRPLWEHTVLVTVPKR